MTQHILSLGAGVQSTAVYLLGCEGRLHIDAAVFADTKEEPVSVVRHLDWLKGLGGPPILVRGRERSLGDNLRRGRDWRKGHTSIPAFTLDQDGRRGMIRRACTGDFKIEVVEQTIRRELLGMKPRQRAPRGRSSSCSASRRTRRPGRSGRSGSSPGRSGACRRTRCSTWAGRGATASST